MSDYLKDVLALMIGIVLVMPVWRTIGAGRIGYCPTQKWIPEASGLTQSPRIRP